MYLTNRRIAPLCSDPYKEVFVEQPELTNNDNRFYSIPSVQIDPKVLPLFFEIL